MVQQPYTPDLQAQRLAMGQLADLDRPRMVPLTRLRAKAEEWKGLLRKHAPIARQMVVVNGRIVFTPDRASRRYTFLAPGTLTDFFSGMVCPQAVASPMVHAPLPKGKRVA